MDGRSRRNSRLSWPHRGNCAILFDDDGLVGGGEPPIRRETMIRAHRRMGRENADDNETFRRAGHCNRPTMRLLGSSRWRTRTGVSLLPRAHRLQAERGTLSVRIVRTKDRKKRKKELAIVINTVVDSVSKSKTKHVNSA